MEFVDPPTWIVFDETPNDPSYSSQWYLPKVNAPEGWDVTHGNSNYSIAVVDRGVDINHSDLQNKILGGESSTSDDHGTQVAGVAAASANNSTGIAGMGWDIRITPYDTENGSGNLSDLTSAKNHSNVRVINLRWFLVILNTSNNTYRPANINEVQAYQNVINEAISAGKIVVASGGNPPSSITVGGTTYTPSFSVPFVQYPAAFDNVVAVSATNSSDVLQSGYNYGSFLDLAAPGISIFTTDLGGGYETVNGTSFSAPLT